MISNTVIVLLIAFVVAAFNGSDSVYVWVVMGSSLSIALMFDWFNICMTLNKDKRESD